MADGLANLVIHPSRSAEKPQPEPVGKGRPGPEPEPIDGNTRQSLDGDDDGG
jgi:hypothetical protein